MNNQNHLYLVSSKFSIESAPLSYWLLSLDFTIDHLSHEKQNLIALFALSNALLCDIFYYDDEGNLHPSDAMDFDAMLANAESYQFVIQDNHPYFLTEVEQCKAVNETEITALFQLISRQNIGLEDFQSEAIRPLVKAQQMH